MKPSELPHPPNRPHPRDLVDVPEISAMRSAASTARLEPLALIRRPVPATFTSWLGALSPDRWPDGRFLADIRDVPAALITLFAQCGVPEGEPASGWLGDITALAEHFVQVSGEPLVDVRLEQIAGNACWKFHRDNVPVRLITTYLGPGTEIVPLEHGQTALDQQQAYRGPLRRLTPAFVAIFRGGAQGIVHRSPPIADTGALRSMLCLNSPSRASPDLWVPAT